MTPDQVDKSAINLANKMNEKLLAHHTKLFDWFELDKIAKDHLAIEKTYMTPIKANAVNSWRSEVNRVYRRTPKSAHQLNKRIHHSAPKDRELETPIKHRTKSAPSKQKYQLNQSFQKLSLGERVNNISIHYNAERKQNSARDSEITKDSTTTTYPSDETKSTVTNFSDDSLSSEELLEIIPPVRPYKPHISMRSDSNQLLNYLTVDDCRVAARYKPRHEINYVATYDKDKASDAETRLPEESFCSQDTMELPMEMSTGSVLTTLSSLKEQDQMFRALLKKKRKLEAVKSSSYHRIINNLETKHKLPEADKINLEIGSDTRVGSHFYRKINSALHKKIDKLVNAKKENMRAMIV